MNEMNITSAQYIAADGNNVSVLIVADGETLSVPLQEGNRHYDEIMRQVNEGTLTIADAE
jgi:hypothetical protein